jgi:hypothetical protein
MAEEDSLTLMAITFRTRVCACTNSRARIPRDCCTCTCTLQVKALRLQRAMFEVPWYSRGHGDHADDEDQVFDMLDQIMATQVRSWHSMAGQGR